MDHLYCLSGLGADHRIFQKLEVSGSTMYPLEWLLPKGKQESLNEYANRIAITINHESPVLIGVSFGGMMAIEIAKIIPVKAVILISSVKTDLELPAWMKRFGKLKMDFLIPTVPLKSIKPLKSIRPIQNYFLGASTDEEISIANEFRDNVDPALLKWSIRQVFNWKNDWQPPRIYHIHGGNDKLFPIRNVRPTHIIPDGGHFMVMNQFDRINKILAEILGEIA